MCWRKASSGPSCRALSRWPAKFGGHTRRPQFELSRMMLLPCPGARKAEPYATRIDSSCIRLSHRVQYSGDGFRDPLPAGSLGGQLLLAGCSQPIHFGALLILRNLPFRGNPALAFEPVERRVKRSRIDLQNVAGVRADRLAESVSVPRTPLQRLQDEQVERPLQQLN